MKIFTTAPGRKIRVLRLFSTVILLLANMMLFAQQKKITGSVMNPSDGKPVPDVNIQVKGTSRGTSTNAKGEFSLIVSDNEILLVSAIGFQTREVKVGKQDHIFIQLTGAASELQNVVVTALGIKRDEKALGYAVTKVDSSQLTDAVASNWTDALSGKVAGLNLIRSGSGPAGSNKIILRGENNLTSDNEALLVVDGVVINNSGGRRSSNGSDNVYATGSDNLPADYGSVLNDINPQDIESVSVLKGPAAAALYGQRAANGAIIITTKSSYSKKKGHFNVKYTANGSVESVNRYPELQYEYGQGLDGAAYYSFGAGPDGASTSGTSSAYGPRFDGQMFFQYDPVTQARGTTRTPWVPYNNINDFWDVGRNLTNTLSIDGKIFGGSTAVRLSFSNQNNTWIIPNTGFIRKAASLSTSSDITKKLKFSTKVNYGFRKSNNLPAAGYGNQSLMYWYIFWQPSADLNWLKNYWTNGSRYQLIRYPFSTYPENPYAVVNEFLNKTRRNNVTGNLTANYQFTKEFSFQVRGSLDWANDKRSQLRPWDAGTRLPKGSFRTQNIYAKEASVDFLARYTKDINDDINLTATLGGSQLKNWYDKSDLRADGLVVPQVYSLDNAMYPLISIPDTSRYQLNSLYALISASFKNYLFADLTFRRDWNSVLATPNRTDNVGFSYPSLSVSFILSDFATLPRTINYAKLRASVASVGSGTTVPYRTAYTYPYAANGTYPDSALVNPTTLPNENLKPLLTTTVELGAEVKMLKNRLSFDLAIYRGATKNQILTRVVDRATGYNAAVINAGQVNNSGLEISVNATPVSRKKGLTWTVFGTFSTNQNKIISMPDSSVVLRTGPVAGGQIVAKIGGSMGDLYGRGYQRAPDGQIVFDGESGVAKITEDVVYLGNTIPKIKASLGNTFKYGQFSLSVLFDAQLGAVAHSLLNYKMVEQGKLKSTLPGRYSGIIGNGVVENNDHSYRKNDVVAYDIDEYYRSLMGADNAEGSTFSTDFLKFREASLNYRFTPKFLKKVGLSSATLGVYGRNLFIWSPWPMFDPEFGTLSGTDIVTGFEIGQFPSSRTLGFNLSLGF